jgi:hypothetical protein
MFSCFDFSSWLIKSFTLRDDITVKMDIEGAEYDQLKRIIDDRSIFLVRRLVCEWHRDRFPETSRELHDRVRHTVAAIAAVEDWS